MYELISLLYNVYDIIRKMTKGLGVTRLFFVHWILELLFTHCFLLVDKYDIHTYIKRIYVAPIKANCL